MPATAPPARGGAATAAESGSGRSSAPVTASLTAVWAGTAGDGCGEALGTGAGLAPPRSSALSKMLIARMLAATPPIQAPRVDPHAATEWTTRRREPLR